MNRYDIPTTVTNIINKAIEIELADASDILALGATHADDCDGLVNELVEWAYCNRHHSNHHHIIAPLADEYYASKTK